MVSPLPICTRTTTTKRETRRGRGQRTHWERKLRYDVIANSRDQGTSADVLPAGTRHTQQATIHDASNTNAKPSTVVSNHDAKHDQHRHER